MSNKRKVRIKHAEVVERFARRLRELRAERGMTQSELALGAKVTATYISKLESAGAAPGIDLVEKLAAALGVGLTDLIPPTQAANPNSTARERAQVLFDTVLKTADQQAFALLNPFLALLVESSSRRV